MGVCKRAISPVDIGASHLNWSLISMVGEGNSVNVPLSADWREFVVIGADMGNPHAVIFLDTLYGFAGTTMAPSLRLTGFSPPQRTCIKSRIQV